MTITPALPDKLPEVIWAQHLSLTCDRLAWSGAVGHCPKCDAEVPPEFRYWCSVVYHRRFLYDHFWANARKRSINKHHGRCARQGCRRTDGLQVNHIIPFYGADRPTYTCMNHQDNLEPLCPEHHQYETNRQRRERAGLPTPSREDIIAANVADLSAVNVCGMPKRNGEPCTRWVDPGTVCWQHKTSQTRRSGVIGQYW